MTFRATEKEVRNTFLRCIAKVYREKEYFKALEEEVTA